MTGPIHVHSAASEWNSAEESFSLLTYSVLQGVFSGDVKLGFVESLLASNDSKLRRNGAWMLSELGEGARPLLSTCIGLLSDRDTTITVSAISTIVALGKDAVDRSIAAGATNLLSHESEIVRVGVLPLLLLCSAESLRDYFDDSSAASSQITNHDIPALLVGEQSKEADVVGYYISCLHSPRPSTRLASLIGAIRRLPALAPVVLAAIQSEDVELRKAGAEYGSTLGECAIPLLSKVALSDDVVGVRSRAVHSLARLVQLDNELRGIASRLLGDDSEAIRYGAMCMLRNALPLTTMEMRQVVDALRDSSEGVRFTAAQIIFTISQGSASVEVDPIADALMSCALNTTIDVSVRKDVWRLLSRCSDSVISTELGRMNEAIRTAVATGSMAHDLFS